MAIDDETGTIRNSRWRKRRKTNNFQSRFVYYSRDSCSIGGRGEGGGHRTSFLFFPNFLFGGKNRGWGTRVARVSRVDEPRRYEIPSRLLFSAENARAKDFPGKPLICILIEEIITFTGVWPIYKVNRLTPPPFPPLRAMNI